MVRLLENRRPCLLFAAVLVAIAALDGVTLFGFIKTSLTVTPVQVTEALTRLVKSILFVIGVFGFGPSLVNASRSQKPLKVVSDLYKTIFSIP